MGERNEMRTVVAEVLGCHYKDESQAAERHVIVACCCGFTGNYVTWREHVAEKVLDALGLEQVGFVHPRRAMTHRFHTFCSGEESASGVSLYDDHTACFPVYTVGASGRSGG